MAAIRINSPHAVARPSGDLTKLPQDYVESEAVTATKTDESQERRRKKRQI
jgi:hypothetical protein